ncbi:hypothetical protein COO60DRAFT_58204 [Scenedesmus sp. NREL 46B-D3]|nr:hypothetical protein COO60DRAFT_58204 [Scenedesmus sp. NREL 46B-D3]
MIEFEAERQQAGSSSSCAAQQQQQGIDVYCIAPDGDIAMPDTGKYPAARSRQQRLLRQSSSNSSSSRRRRRSRSLDCINEMKLGRRQQRQQMQVQVLIQVHSQLQALRHIMKGYLQLLAAVQQGGALRVDPAAQQQQQQLDPLLHSDKQQQQQQLEEADQAADQGFMQLMITAGNNAEAQAVLTAMRMKKCSLVSSCEETGDAADLVGLQALAQVVACMQQTSAAALPLLLRCMAAAVDEGAAGDSSSRSSVLDLLLCCWLKEVQLTGCSVQQSAAAAAGAVAGGFAGAGSGSSAAGAAATLQKLLAGLCQLLLQLVTQCCEAASAAAPANSREDAGALHGTPAAAAAPRAHVVQLANNLMLGTSLLLLHWPDDACCRQLQCQQASFWRQSIWVNALKGASVQVDKVFAQISSQVRTDMLKQHGRAVKAAAAAAAAAAAGGRFGQQM